MRAPFSTVGDLQTPIPLTLNIFRIFQISPPPPLKRYSVPDPDYEDSFRDGRSHWRRAQLH